MGQINSAGPVHGPDWAPHHHSWNWGLGPHTNPPPSWDQPLGTHATSICPGLGSRGPILLLLCPHTLGMDPVPPSTLNLVNRAIACKPSHRIVGSPVGWMTPCQELILACGLRVEHPCTRALDQNAVEQSPELGCIYVTLIVPVLAEM